MPLRSLPYPFAVASALLIATAAHAQEYKVGDLVIDHAIARPTMPGQTSGAAYLSIENRGRNADKLLSAASPAAQSVEIHTMKMEGNLMKMREVPNVAIPPSSTVLMKPGDGYHFMLIGLKQPLKPADKLPMTLTFEKSGKVNVTAVVQGRDAQDSASAKDADGHEHHH
jgi:copper(I)-binding protein